LRVASSQLASVYSPYSPRIFELNKSKWRTTPILQVDKCNFAELVEQILDVLGADVRRQVTHINAALVA